MDNKTIKLWLENRLDGEIEKPYTEVLEAFKASSYFERYIFEPFTDLADMLDLFITAKDGLNSTYEIKDFIALRDEVKRVLHEEACTLAGIN